MTISRTVAYAIEATMDLAAAQPDRPVPGSELAERGKMPVRFLLHVLRILVKQGVLRSSRGADGGYSLNRDPEALTLLDVIKPFKIRLALSELEQSEFLRMNNDLMKTFNQAADAARRELQKKTIADLLENWRVVEHVRPWQCP
jgi:Rrf2 family protein